MSYILNALKKSEQERQRENGPSLNSVHGSVPGFQKRYSKKKTTLALWCLSAITLGLAFSVSYYISLHTSPVDLPVETAVPPKPTAPSSTSPSLTPSRTTTVPLMLAREEKKIVRVNKEGRLLTAGETPKQTGTKHQSLPSTQQLPEEVKRNIPEITLAGHTYSETPGQRMVIINNKILREGNTLDGNIRLVEITWDGVVLDYNGTQFQQHIK